MKKKLYLVRHGKSDWSNPKLRDFDRPLKKRGLRNARTMAKILKEKNIKPDCIVTSSARRALDTATIFSEQLDVPPEKFLPDESVYFASPSELINLIKQQDDSVETLMIFGHNPGFTNLANFFLPEALNNIPTAGFVYLEFDAESWKQISKSNVAAHYYDYPKKYDE